MTSLRLALLGVPEVLKAFESDPMLPEAVHQAGEALECNLKLGRIGEFESPDGLLLTNSRARSSLPKSIPVGFLELPLKGSALGRFQTLKSCLVSLGEAVLLGRVCREHDESRVHRPSGR